MSVRQPRVLPYLLVAPTVFFVLVFTVFPLALSAWGSLFKHKLNIPKYAEPVFAGLANYSDLFQDSEFLQVLANTGLYLLLLLPATLVAALTLAFLVERKLPGLTFFRLSLFHPAVLPLVSAATLWLFLFTPGYGLWNQLLHVFGYQGPENWTGTPAWHSRLWSWWPSGRTSGSACCFFWLDFKRWMSRSLRPPGSTAPGD